MRKVLTLAILLSCMEVQAERFGGANHPSNFNRIIGSSVILNFDFLPKVGKLSDSRLGWSETYWPSNIGGIAYRWNHPNPQPFKYRLHGLEELKKMNQEELGQLSPAELYDISQGDYGYRLTRKVLSMYSTRDLWWEGICHGWSQAASNYPEPDQVVLTNKDGIKVPFGASDVKGLLTMHDAYNYKGTTFAFLGKRCKVNGKVEGESDERDSNPNFPVAELANSEECRDVNAGAFHVVLTNVIGVHSRGFVADVDRFNDVWNQPVVSYNSEVIKEVPLEPGEAVAGIAKKVRVKTRMTYGEELKFYTPELAATGYRGFVSKKPVTGSPDQVFKFKDYEYVLELDGAGRIIGGIWVTQTRPDFMWIFARHKQFTNSPMPLAGLNNIYRPVRR